MKIATALATLVMSTTVADTINCPRPSGRPLSQTTP